jgi:hypothetical protein
VHTISIDSSKSGIIPKTANNDFASLTKTPKQRNISEVVQDKDSLWWTNLTDSSLSGTLHFDMYRWDSLGVEYSPECWLIFPLDTLGNKITVHWTKCIDTKYDFEIVKAVNRISKKYNGQPFMILELVDGSTLKASYPYPEIVQTLNEADKERTLFPDKFIATRP